MIEIDELIIMVYDRKPLWDITSKNYHNRDVSRKLWQDIAEKMNSSSETCKGKWQSLRDHFRREHAKMSKTTTGSAAAQMSSWKHYKKLMFLIDVFSARKMKSNIPPASSEVFEYTNNEEEEEEEEVEEEEREEEEEEEEEEDENATESNNIVNKRQDYIRRKHFVKKKNTKAEAIKRLMTLEKRKVEQLKQINNNNTQASAGDGIEKDEDFYFLMSLLPHLRDIPKKRKLATRIKIQQILIHEGRAEEAQNYEYNIPPSPNDAGPSHLFNFQNSQ